MVLWDICPRAWGVGRGSMTRVQNVGDSAQRRPWHHTPTLGLLCMLCHLTVMEQTAPEIHFPPPTRQGAFQIDRTETDSFPGCSLARPPRGMFPVTQMQRQ